MRYFKQPEFSRILLILLVIAILSPVSLTAANVTKVEIRGPVFDEKSATYNTTLAWNATNFAGFWYNFAGGTFTEYLTIDQNASSLTNTSRIIEGGISATGHPGADKITRCSQKKV